MQLCFDAPVAQPGWQKHSSHQAPAAQGRRSSSQLSDMSTAQSPSVWEQRDSVTRAQPQRWRVVLGLSGQLVQRGHCAGTATNTAGAAPTPSGIGWASGVRPVQSDS